MASVTGYTAARMQAIEDQAIVDGSVQSGNLILERNNGGTINAGSVVGPPGPTGPSGAVGGSTGSNDNRIIRADGTGGTTIQSSLVEIDDSGRITAPLMTVTTAPSVGNDVANKTYVDKSGRGVMGLAGSTSSQALTQDAWTTITGASIAFTPAVGRYYRFTAQMAFLATVSDISGSIAIATAAAPLAFIGRSEIQIPVTTTVTKATVNLIVESQVGWDVSTTFILRAWVNGPANSKGDVSATTFSIEDVGAP